MVIRIPDCSIVIGSLFGAGAVWFSMIASWLDLLEF
jgi:hypothetical protein